MNGSNRPAMGEIRGAFAVTSLEPTLSDDVLIAYAKGSASAADREVVECMLEIDPSLGETIESIRSELEQVTDPLHDPAERERARPTVRIPRLWLLATSGLAAVSLALGAFAWIDLRHLSQSYEMAKRDSSQLSQAASAAQARVVTLEKSLRAAQSNIGSTRTQTQRLESELALAKENLARNLDHPTQDTEGLLARAVSGSLSVTSLVAAVPSFRGTPDLPVDMHPDLTGVRSPVQLSWSGSKGELYKVEIMKGDQPIWRTSVTSNSVTTPPAVLLPGEAYAWRVTEGSKRSKWATFWVPTTQEIVRAYRVEHDASAGPLERGVEYAHDGLLDAADAEFEKVASVAPSLSVKLRRQLSVARGALVSKERP